MFQWTLWCIQQPELVSISQINCGSDLHAGQEIIVRTRHGTMFWFKIGNAVPQGNILSPCLFNLHAEYMQNARLAEYKLEPRCPEKYQQL